MSSDLQVLLFLQTLSKALQPSGGRLPSSHEGLGLLPSTPTPQVDGLFRPSREACKMAVFEHAHSVQR